MTTASPIPLGDAPELAGIVAFLRDIGLSVVAGVVTDDSFLPGMTVRDGQLVYDPAKPGWVGDLLHEAGHLAVTDPAHRATLAEVGHDPAEEMAAIAWSYAAATAIGLPVHTLFHPAYKGGSGYLVDAFASGAFIGLPMLQYLGMTARADEQGPAYPIMRTWLRTQ